MHSKGLQFGLYTSVGDKTCHGGWSPGSLNHWQQDADTFASWGVGKFCCASAHKPGKGMLELTDTETLTSKIALRAAPDYVKIDYCGSGTSPEGPPRSQRPP